MSIPDLIRWQAFYELEPFGPEIDNWRIAQLTAVAASFAGVAHTAEEFMPTVTRSEAADPDAQSAQWRAWWCGRKSQEERNRGGGDAL